MANRGGLRREVLLYGLFNVKESVLLQSDYLGSVTYWSESNAKAVLAADRNLLLLTRVC